MSKKITVLISSFLGNTLEFYDFTLCGVFILILSNVFFPPLSPALALFGSIFAFSAAFWTRPFGALLFGYIGDRFGRKTSLTFSIFLMGVPTCIVGLLPSYESIGYMAPLCLIVCRMLQGLSAGGEYNGAAIFSLEHFQKQNPGVVSGIISASCVFGAITATLAGYVIAVSEVAWLWRIPFILGGVVSFVGFYIRRKLCETDEFLKSREKQKEARTNPILTLLKDRKQKFFQIIMMGLTNGVLSYTLFGFLSLYLTRYVGFKLSSSLFYNLFGLLAFMVGCPLFGWLADSIGARRSIFFANILGIILSPVAFFFLQAPDSLGSIVFGQLLLGLCVGSFVGPSHFFMQQFFPASIRYTGIAFGFSLGMGIAGGSIQLILTASIDATGNLYIPSIILSAIGILCILTCRLYKKEEERETLQDNVTSLEVSHATASASIMNEARISSRPQ